MRHRAVLPLAVLLLAAGCTSTTPGTPRPRARARRRPPIPAGARRERATPDPDRPVVDLDFSLAADLRTVAGTETVEFTPDLPTDELVFRLVPNGPDSTAVGNQLDRHGGARRRRGDQRVRGRRRQPARWPLRRRAVRRAARRGSRPRSRCSSPSGWASGGFERLGATQDVVVVGQRRTAAGLGARRRLGARPVRHRPRRDGEQPGRRHHHLGRGARGAHRADDRRPGRADPAHGAAAAPGRRTSRWPATSAWRRARSPPPRPRWPASG